MRRNLSIEGQTKAVNRIKSDGGGWESERRKVTETVCLYIVRRCAAASRCHILVISAGPFSTFKARFLENLFATAGCVFYPGCNITCHSVCRNGWNATKAEINRLFRTGLFSILPVVIFERCLLMPPEWGWTQGNQQRIKHTERSILEFALFKMKCIPPLIPILICCKLKGNKLPPLESFISCFKLLHLHSRHLSFK